MNDTLKIIREVVGRSDPQPQSLPSLSSLQVAATLILDAIAVAETIELQFGEYLLPPEPGYYVPTSAQPVLTPGEYYFQIRPRKGAVPERVVLQSIEQALPNLDIYNRKGKLAVAAPLIKSLSLEPQVPSRGLQVIYSAVDQTLRSNAAWSQRGVGHCGAFLGDHLREQYRACIPDDDDAMYLLTQKRNQLAAQGRTYELATLERQLVQLESNAELRSKLVDATVDLRTEVQQFIGADKWVMHFHYLRGLDIVVEKTVDFRIFDWERRMASGEWK